MPERSKRKIPLHRILFATDLSPCSEVALPYAGALAKQYGAKLYVAHVIPSEAYVLVPPDKRDTVLQQAQEYGRQRLSAFMQNTAFRDVSHQVILDHGDVWPVLSDIVDKHSIDLIVIGTHGRRGLEKVLLGSAAEEIFRLATRPVLTVGPGVRSAAPSEITLNRILFPTDFSDDSVAALDYAVSLAEEYRAALLFLHATQSLTETSIQVRMEEIDFFRDHLPRATLAGLETTVSHQFLVRAGAPARCILETAGELHVDLIVMGVRSRKGVFARIQPHLPGQTAFQVVSEARCPVLTVRGAARRLNRDGMEHGPAQQAAM